MNQEQANLASRVFCGIRRAPKPLPCCPFCGEHYLGDGKVPCINCQIDESYAQNQGQPPTAECERRT